MKDEQAFPVPIGSEGVFAIGLTKREYFAAAAMQGLCSWDNNLTARNAVQMADELIAELAKENPDAKR